MKMSFDHTALWMKAKLFLNHAMDEGSDREFDERALWAALALELLAKAALAKVSPLLVADPVADDGVSLLAASGLVEHDGPVVSVKAKAAMSRCQRAFKPFSAPEAARILAHRNEYLHGGSPRFTPIPEVAFWPRFWAQAAILVEAVDEDLESLVGPSRVGIVDGHLAQNRRNLDDRYQSRVARARQRVALLDAGQVPSGLASEWAPSDSPGAGLKHRTYRECPACGQEDGVLEGDEELEVEQQVEQIDEDDFDVWYEVTVAAERFSCGRCHIVLDGVEMLERGELDTEFTIQGSPEDYYEPEYDNE